MKKLILLLSFIIFSLSGYTQGKINSFKIEDGKLVWEKIFNTDLDFDQLVVAVKKTKLLSNIKVGENKITATVDSVRTNHCEAGYSFTECPHNISESIMSGVVELKFKTGAYKIDFRDIGFVSTKKGTGGRRYSIEWYELRRRNTMFQSNFRDKTSKIYSYEFSKLFQFNKFISDDNW